MSAQRKKQKTRFVCQSCGYESPKWLGRCSECDSWGSFVEEKVSPAPAAARGVSPSTVAVPQHLDAVVSETESRITTSSEEFNRVLGGGIVPGSVVLVGGDPGIGKSTLMLQQGALLARTNTVLYVSGEESAEQTKMRAERLGLRAEHFYVLPETDLDAVLVAVDELAPALLVIDSIQTMYRPLLESAAGSISQVRECAQALIYKAKKSGVAVFIIGHVTKEGYVAGPKTLEHMVDTLLLFEGDRDHFYRILRTSKNRFGSTREIGVFEMTDRGLNEVKNPSALFLSERRTGSHGSCVTCVLEGTRPILLEVQALVAPTNYGVPQRTASGVDHRRVALLLAVLDKRAGLKLSAHDVFVNVAGGAKIDEPAADLATIVSVASSFKNKPVAADAVLLGEVGLGGEIRAVIHIDKRVSEAEKMGFTKVVFPKSNEKGLRAGSNIQCIAASDVGEALDAVMDKPAMDTSS